MPQVHRSIDDASHPWHPRSLAENPLLRAMIAGYAAIFVWSAIAPRDRATWLLENVLVVVCLAALFIVYRRSNFSNLSWLLIFCFLALHAIGSHYTYSQAPPGAWFVSDAEVGRNHYDRVVHFSFGLLLFYPFRELARRELHLRGVWTYVVPVLTILALSAAYELIEGWTARIAAPGLGHAFLGSQGDPWDAQKDMALATLGAGLAVLGTALYRVRRHREPWIVLAEADTEDEKKAAERSQKPVVTK